MSGQVKRLQRAERFPAEKRFRNRRRLRAPRSEPEPVENPRNLRRRYPGFAQEMKRPNVRNASLFVKRRNNATFERMRPNLRAGSPTQFVRAPAEGLEAAAKLLHNNYLTEGGSYYYGKTISCVQRRYCPGSSTWVGLVYGCMKYIIK